MKTTNELPLISVLVKFGIIINASTNRENTHEIKFFYFNDSYS